MMEKEILELLENMVNAVNNNKVTRLKTEYWIFELTMIAKELHKKELDDSKPV